MTRTFEHIPEVGDEVTHISGEESGRVIAKYQAPHESLGGVMQGKRNLTKILLDVRIGDERIRYATPMKNWRVAAKNKDILE